MTKWLIGVYSFNFIQFQLYFNLYLLGLGCLGTFVVIVSKSTALGVATTLVPGNVSRLEAALLAVVLSAQNARNTGSHLNTPANLLGGIMVLINACEKLCDSCRETLLMREELLDVLENQNVSISKTIESLVTPTEEIHDCMRRGTRIPDKKKISYTIEYEVD